MKLVSAVLLSIVCAGCLSRAHRAHVVESPDPTVGDLRCAQPRLSLLEALHYEPSTGPQACEPRE